MYSDIVTELDDKTGRVHVTIPADVVQALGWQQDTSILWIAEPQEGTLVAKTVKYSLAEQK